MISIVVYGRNDSHGYNLHKRAAISLNCLAEILSDPDDEIIFVDYNTPDDLPTFPEAIQDTLTPKLWQRMRVIRVRPRHHEHIRLKTHLVTVEPIARNIGLRRSNPANRWVLSTNTDMVFAARRPFASLSEAMTTLERGYYCLPRFEIPETLWESTDRLKPRRIITALNRFGRDLHLNELIRCPHPVQFDGPGDFQLVTREDFFAIGGFNEEMLHGWHVDSNFAKRMQIHFGQVGDAIDRVSGFHLGHTRVVGVAHGGHNRPENDIRRFVDDITTPQVPACADTWGLNGVELEEFHLSDMRNTLFANALKTALPGMRAHHFENSYELAAYDSPDYPVEHTVPHLLDLLITAAPQDVIGWFGTRASLFRLLGTALAAAGRGNPILVAESAAHVVDGTAFERVKVVPDEQVLQDADLFVFEFGARSQDRRRRKRRDWSLADLDAVAPVRRGFLGLVDSEIEAHAAGRPLRRIIAVNAMHNQFEALVHNAVSVNRTPFSTRVRQGYAIVPADQVKTDACDPKELGAWLRRRMGRRQGVPITETVRLHTTLHEMVGGAMSPERRWAALRVATNLLALAEHPALARTFDPEQLAACRRMIEAERHSVALRGRVAVAVVDEACDPRRHPSRLGAIEDWEDPDFQRFAKLYFTGAFAANVFRRSRGIWFRCHILSVLARLGWGDGGQRTLVVTDNRPDAIHHLLSNHYRHVDVVLGGGRRFPHVPGVWCEPSRLHVVPSLPSAVEPYGSVVAVWDRFGRKSRLKTAFESLAALAALVGDGGVVVLACHMDLETPPSADRFTPGLAADPGFAAACLSHLGLEMLPAAPAAISVATLDSYAVQPEARLVPHFICDDQGRLFTNAVWFFVKRHAAEAGGGARLAAIGRRINRDLAKGGK